MRYARVISNGIIAPDLTDAIEFDHRGVRPAFVCADECCKAPMRFRRGSPAEGGSKPRDHHFSTVADKKHITGCRSYEWSAENKQSLSIRDALAQGKKILLQMDFWEENSLGKKFYGVSSGRTGLQTLAAYKAQNTSRGGDIQYLSVAAHDIHDMLRMIRVLQESGHKDALERTTISYHGHVMGYDSFFVDNSEKSLRRLFNRICRGGETFMQQDGLTMGFPRLLTLNPTKREARGDGDKGGVRGNRVCYDWRKGGVVLLLQEVVVRNDNVRSELAGRSASSIIALPAVNIAESAQAYGRYRDGSAKEYLTINWHVFGAYQHAPMHGQADLASKKKKQITLEF